MMYENENPNSGSYYQVPGTEGQPPVYVQPGKNKKKKGGFGRFCRKILAGACVGLSFGLCAGAGLYAVGESTGLLEKLEATYNIAEGDHTQKPPAAGNSSNSDNGKNEGSANADYADSNSGISTAPVINISDMGGTADMSAMVEEVMPAMVSIVNTQTEQYYYFGQIVERQGGGSGSGIIVGQNDTELLIATNYHVIEGAEELTVHFIDNTEAEATVKGSDPDMDLAVIAVPFDKLDMSTRAAITIARLGDSDSLKVGEPVVAIGNALGYGQSMTGGWISALNREVELEDGSTGTFIQTDAAINPGNSGGALLNVRGEVIGINSNKIGGTLVDGVGYAIPISAAQPILEDLMLRETRDRVDEDSMGYLGIIPQSVTAQAAEIYGMPQGVYVSGIDEGTPAAKGGMLQGDIITKFDGIRLYSEEDLRETLEYYKAGETVEILVMRIENGEWKENTLTVELGSRP